MRSVLVEAGFIKTAVPLSSTPAELPVLNMRVLETCWVGLRMHEPRLVCVTWNAEDGERRQCVPLFVMPHLLGRHQYHPTTLVEGGLRLGVDLFFEPDQQMSWFQSLNTAFFWVFLKTPTQIPSFLIMKVVGDVCTWQRHHYFKTRDPHVENHSQRDDWTDGSSRVIFTVGRRYHFNTVVYYGRKEDPRILAFNAADNDQVIHMFKIAAPPAYLLERVQRKLGRNT